MTTTKTTADRCRLHLERLRPTFRLFQDVLELLEDQDLQPQPQNAVGLNVLRMLSTELRRDIEQLDMDLHYGTRPNLGDYGHDSEGGEL